MKRTTLILLGWLLVLTHYLPDNQNPQFVTDTALIFQNRTACEDARKFFVPDGPPATTAKPYDVTPCLPTRTAPHREYQPLAQ